MGKGRIYYAVLALLFSSVALAQVETEIDWEQLVAYPSACSTGNFVSTLADTPTCSSPTGGAGITYSSGTISTASSESGFLSSDGPVTCGDGTAGRMALVSTDPVISYCAGSPTADLGYIPYGLSDGRAQIAVSSTTATGLAVNGANCSAGSYARGVSEFGIAEDCTADDDAPDAGDFGALALTGVVTSSGLATSFNYTNTEASNSLGAEESVFTTDGTGGGLLFEGSTADTIEGLLVWAPDTSSKTITLPNLTGTVIVGPASLTDEAIVRTDGTSGALVQGYTSGAPTISDTGGVTIPTTLVVDTSTLVVDATNNRIGIGDATPDGALDCPNGAAWFARQANAFGTTSSYTTLVLDGDSNGALYAGGRASASNEPYTGLSMWDDGISRYLYFGGGGWGVPDSTDIYFYTAPSYTETNDTGVFRFAIEFDGDVIVDPNNTNEADFRLPYGATQTSNDNGEILVDSTDNQFVFRSNAADRVLFGELLACNVRDNLDGTDDRPVFSPNENVTLLRAWCTCTGTCSPTIATITLENARNGGVDSLHGGASITCIADTGAVTATTVNSDNTVSGLTLVRYDVTNTPDPATDEYTVCFAYSIDRQ